MTKSESENNNSRQIENINYYPDDLMIDEDVIFSSKINKLMPIYYYVTNKRIFSENKLTGKKEEIMPTNVADLHIEQNFISKYFDKGNILIMHSNYKGEIPIMRRKYFTIKNVQNPKEAFAYLKKRIDQLNKK